jgi:hypothetical protein
MVAHEGEQLHVITLFIVEPHERDLGLHHSSATQRLDPPSSTSSSVPCTSSFSQSRAPGLLYMHSSSVANGTSSCPETKARGAAARCSFVIGEKAATPAVGADVQLSRARGSY